jgi:hypothetical protein
MWWKGNREEPQEPTNEEQEAPEVMAYNGPISEQMFRVMIFMTVTQPDGTPFAARYSMIIPDYNMDSFLSVLNANSVVYTVIPLEMELWEREEEGN